MHRHMPALGLSAAGAGNALFCSRLLRWFYVEKREILVSVRLWNSMECFPLQDGSEGFVLEGEPCCSPCAGGA